MSVGRLLKQSVLEGSHCLVWLGTPMGCCVLTSGWLGNGNILVPAPLEGTLDSGWIGLILGAVKSEDLLVLGTAGVGFTSVRPLGREEPYCEGLLVFGTGGGGGSLPVLLVLPG